MKSKLIIVPGGLPDRDRLKKTGAELIPVMEQRLTEKMNELLKVSSQEIPRKDYFKGMTAKMKLQDALMDEIKFLAKKLKTLRGRIIQFPRGDGYALYMVVKTGRRTARVEWIDYCDAWRDERVDRNPELPLDYVAQKVNGQDALAKIFG
jgi:hypothetical protein